MTIVYLFQNTEDQRLIYYGQLLNDSVTLKDVFTRYEADEESHTVHLVCMPSKESLKLQARKMSEESNKKKVKEGAPSASGSFNNERLTSEGDEETLPTEEENSNESRHYCLHTGSYQPWMSGLYTQPTEAYNYMQQWAWMQRAYANYYMSQYMDM